MSSFSDSENFNPTFDQVYGLDQSQANNHQSHPPSFKEYTKSISQPFASRSIYVKQSSISPQNRVPIVTSFHKNDANSSVEKMLITDARENENGVLRQMNNSHSNSTNLRVLSSIISPYKTVEYEDEMKKNYLKLVKKKEVTTPVDSDYDGVPLLDLYKDDDTRSKMDPISATILESGLPCGAMSPSHTEAQPLTPSKSNADNSDDPRISYLNQHHAYVDVHYPNYTKPLAKNGTPLDLSQVPKNTLASPLFDYEEPKLSQDESKLLLVLSHDIKMTNGGSYNEDQFEIQELEDDNEGYGISSIVVSFFQKLFKVGPYSTETKYYRKYPWAKIFYNFEHPADPEDQITLYEKTAKAHSFERNNTEMFPINAFVSSPNLEEFSKSTEGLRSSKRKVGLAPKIKQPTGA